MTIHYNMACPCCNEKEIGFWVFKKKIKIYCKEKIKDLGKNKDGYSIECQKHGRINFIFN